MNILATDKRAQILNCLVEGCSMRSTTRLTGAAKKTVERMLVSAGHACAAYMDKAMRNLPCNVLQVDELWSFTLCKQANVPKKLKGKSDIGDTWTWIALDSKTKLIPCFHVGKRDSTDAYKFISDLAGRLASRVQLTSDGHKAYLQAVEDAFGSEIDYAQLIKLYGNEHGPSTEVRYSPPVCIGARKKSIIGKPKRGLVSTSHIERQNLTVRMGNRRFTRLTNAFSKKLENHKHHAAIHFMHYNFCRIHQTLRVTPAIRKRPMSFWPAWKNTCDRSPALCIFTPAKWLQAIGPWWIKLTKSPSTSFSPTNKRRTITKRTHCTLNSSITC
jgi:IS1 family transposase